MVSAGDVIFSVLPLALLIGLLVKKNPWPSSIALPVSALVIFILRLAYFGMGSLMAVAEVFVGFMTALTPLTIVFCAITFFRILEFTGCLAAIKKFLNNIAPNLLVQTMLVAWNFSFLLEGIAGFGTPAALSAPLLVAAGVPAKRAAACALIMNSVPVTFGAVGTPVWFGFSQLDLNDDDFVRIGSRATLLSLIPAHVAPFLALSLVVPWSEIRRHWLFLLLSIWVSVGPFLAFAFLSAEFPSLIGGFVGLLAAGALAKFKIGVPDPVPTAERVRGRVSDAAGHEDATTHAQPAADTSAVELTETTVRTGGDAGREGGLAHTSKDGSTAAASSGGASSAQQVGGLQFGSAMTEGGAEEAKPEAATAPDAGRAAPASAAASASGAADGSVGHEDSSASAPPTIATDEEAGTQLVPVGSPRSDDEQLAAVAQVPRTHTSSSPAVASPVVRLQREAPLPSAAAALAPIAGVVLILLITRIITPLRDWLGSTTPGFTLSLRSFGDVVISSSLVVQWKAVLRAGGPQPDGTIAKAPAADYKFLLTPALVPFIIVGFFTVLAFRRPLGFSCTAAIHRRLCGKRSVAATRHGARASPRTTTAAAAHADAPSTPRTPGGSRMPRTVEAVERQEPPTPLTTADSDDEEEGGGTERSVAAPAGTKVDASFKDCALGAWRRVFPHAVVALLASLVFVRQLLSGGSKAPAGLLGEFLSDVFGSWFAIIAPFIGALGAFFSGSATVSNLTFGGIQRTAAQAVGLDVFWVLALQVTGAAFGNQICIGNILAVASILGLLDANTTPAEEEDDVDTASDTRASSTTSSHRTPEPPRKDSPEGAILRMTILPCVCSLVLLAVQGVIIA